MIGWNQTLGLGALLSSATSHHGDCKQGGDAHRDCRSCIPPPRPPGVRVDWEAEALAGPGDSGFGGGWVEETERYWEDKKGSKLRFDSFDGSSGDIFSRHDHSTVKQRERHPHDE